MILLDTQVVVWLIGDNPKLGWQARSSIEHERERSISAMVSWEIAMMVDKGRFTLEMPLAAWLDTSIRNIKAHEVAVTGAIARDAGSLPGGIHGDPCDRIMIATARALACPIITSDRKILDYAAVGHVRAIDARR